MITPHGLAEIEDAYAKALEDEEKARNNLNQAIKRVIDLSNAMNCDHSDLDHKGSFMYAETQCKKCGYTWYD